MELTNKIATRFARASVRSGCCTGSRSHLDHLESWIYDPDTRIVFLLSPMPPGGRGGGEGGRAGGLVSEARGTEMPLRPADRSNRIVLRYESLRSRCDFGSVYGILRGIAEGTRVSFSLSPSLFLCGRNGLSRIERPSVTRRAAILLPINNARADLRRHVEIGA
jgi:hypothetical protein